MEELTAFANFFASAIRLTAPIALGTLACTISERAGVINIGIEGTMLFSGFMAAVGTWYTGSPWFGLLCGCLGGVLISAILGILAIYCNGQQIVIGIGINLFAPGLAYMLMRSLWDTTGISPWISGFESLQIPVIKDIPIISILFSGYSACIYLGIIVVIVMQFLLHKTAWGLRIRSAGENPAVVATLGINVYRLRMFAVLLGGFFAGMAGSVMCLSSANVFVNDMSAGSGFMAFAANQFGQWSPVGGYLATLLFGVMSAFRMRLQSLGVATQLTQMLPYVAVLIGLKITGTRMRAPAANGEPYAHPLTIPQVHKRVNKKAKGTGNKD
nr:ABC transporter permease [uncultured Oscillibacter sp.]